MQETKTKELQEIAVVTGYDVHSSGLTFEKFVRALQKAYDLGYEAGFLDGSEAVREELYGEYVKMVGPQL